MGGHLVLAQPLAQLMGHSLGQLPGVDEDQGGSVAGDVARDTVDDLAPLIARDRGLELAVGQLQRQIEAAAVPAVDDRGERLARPHQQAGRRLDRLDGGREADANRRMTGDCLEPLERERQMRAPLVAREGVDLVDDDCFHGGDRRPGPLGGQVQVKRFRRGHEEVRRPADHRLPLG
jgi:hypothetical protein